MASKGDKMKIKPCKIGLGCMHAWSYGITGTKHNWSKSCKDIKDCGNLIDTKYKSKNTGYTGYTG